MKMQLRAAAVLLLAACQAQDRVASKTEAEAVAVAGVALPAGARILSPAAGSQPGPAGRVETRACVPGTGAEVAEQVRAALAPNWSPVQVIPSKNLPGRWVIVGAHETSGVAGVVDDVRRGPCGPAEVFLSLGVHSAPAETGPAATGAGAPGVRAAGSSRPPVVLVPADP